MLRELAAEKAYALADFDKHNKCYRARGSSFTSTPEQNYKTIHPTVFGVLVKHGWVERIDHKYIISQTGREILVTLGSSDFNCERPVFTADEIGELLRSKYPAPDWVFFEELRFGTGYGKFVDQRIDAWAMHTWPSKNFLKIAFEIKIYRSDFLKELHDPYKRKPALSVSNQFYFIGPRGLMTKHEMPDECGLMEVLPDGSIKTIKAAPERKIAEPSWNFLASLARRIQGCVEK